MEKSKTYYVAIGGALLAIIGLITPWFRVSIPNYIRMLEDYNGIFKWSSSGFGLMGSFGSGFGGFLMGIGILFIVLASVAVIAYSIWKVLTHNPSVFDARFFIISGGVILFFTVLVSGGTTFFITLLLSVLPRITGGDISEFDFGVTASSGIGVYLTILAGIAILLAGLFAKGDLKLSGMVNMQHRRQSAQPYYPQQPYQQPYQPQGQWQAPQQPPQQPYQRPGQWQAPQQPYQQPGQWQAPQQGPEEPNQWQAPQN